ncbi:GNAT family N-acetyltransferase [Pseudonocardia xinjiangensis]|uniref:GNAT family N-acetyltransferase n=1 Tax=Pseudonocardia xinjiangensis TaxID=75289 RepID=UPI003D94FA28
MLPHLRDSTIVLRAWLPSDAEWYACCTRDAEITRFTTDPSNLTADDVVAAINALSSNPRHEGFLVADARTGSRLGNVALEHADGTGDVSYWVAAEARGRGVARRALALLTRWAFAHLDLQVIRLWTHADNAPSRAAAERAGFTRNRSGDRLREVKGEVWPTVAYELRRRTPTAAPPPEG